MRMATEDEVSGRLKEYLADLGGETLVITREGQPSALLVPVPPTPIRRARPSPRIPVSAPSWRDPVLSSPPDRASRKTSSGRGWQRRLVRGSSALAGDRLARLGRRPRHACVRTLPEPPVTTMTRGRRA